jgi:hypothetical protein
MHIKNQGKNESSGDSPEAHEQAPSALPVESLLSGVRGFSCGSEPKKRDLNTKKLPSFPLPFPFFLFTCNYHHKKADRGT